MVVRVRGRVPTRTRLRGSSSAPATLRRRRPARQFLSKAGFPVGGTPGSAARSDRLLAEAAGCLGVLVLGTSKKDVLVGREVRFLREHLVVLAYVARHRSQLANTVAQRLQLS